MILRVLFVVLLTTGSATAGVYSSVEGPPFDFDDDGLPKSLPSSGFHSRLADVLDALIAPNGQAPRPESLRGKYVALYQSLSKRPNDELTSDELRDLSAAMLRLGKISEAIERLRPLSRDRRATFFTGTHLAHADASAGQWFEAMEAQQVARSEFPSEIEGFTPAQVAWYKKVEREYYLKWLQGRTREQRGGVGRVEEVDDLFGGVRFVGESGDYEPGTIAAAERAKLPPDALAIAQQLSLWSPGDTRLYWLVGELLNADGDVAGAAMVFDACVGDSRRFQNPTLSEHRRTLKEYLLAKDEERRKTEEEAWKPDESRVWWVLMIAGPLALLLVAWQVWVWVRRFRR